MDDHGLSFLPFDPGDTEQWLMYGSEEEEDLLRRSGNMDPGPNPGCARVSVVLVIIGILLPLAVGAGIIALLDGNIPLLILCAVITVALFAVLLK